MMLPCTLLFLNIFLGILIGSTRNTRIWTWCEGLIHWKRSWCWERLKAAEGDDRGWDNWMASPTQWTWVWVNSGSWRWTGRPGLLQSMGSQRVGHDSGLTELNWTPGTELNWTPVTLNNQTYLPHPSGQGALLYPRTFSPNFTPPDHWLCHFPTHFQQITFGLLSRINRSQ